MIDLEVIIVIAGAFLTAFLVSTLIIRLGIPKLQDDAIETKSTAPADPVATLLEQGRLPESSSSAVFDIKSTGFWIGLCETFLIFVLVFANAFSALAIIIGAKQFVRNEKIKINPSYYLLGTLANLCIAVLFAIAARAFAVSL